MTARVGLQFLRWVGISLGVVLLLSILVPTTCSSSSGGRYEIHLIARFDGPLVAQLFNPEGCQKEAGLRVLAFGHAVGVAIFATYRLRRRSSGADRSGEERP